MYYGIDIGGSKVAWAVFDEQGQELARQVCPTPHSYTSLRQLIHAWVKEADGSWHTKGRLGIGFPGVRESSGRVLAANVPSIHGQYLTADLAQDLDRCVVADNDANCFLLSESVGGAAADAKLALALTLGTGVGGAVIHQGKLVNSARGSSGEFGHGGIQASLLARYPNLPLFTCGCGQVGCLETYVSGTGLANLYQHLVNSAGQATSPSTPVATKAVATKPVSVKLAGPAIIRAWQQGEALAAECVDMYVDILASALANLMTQLDPDIVVLGGGLSEQAWLYEQLNARIPKYLMRQMSAAPVVAAHFGGSGGVRGAALLAKCGA
ncbi:N-acetylglucosamine kinase [Oceanisphaera profunda]|uniref:N-acetylglucosamine kinase n=1 Tax=Oceanisphaera profunda TaxID=1416627 RepID=A0A1Y0D7P1_9GAMM|nr:ROK family protein [Oceanisphaera profunda]ART83558.1 N-acetylglucosamine kinase [Oceanisphaera profunda]